MKYLIVLILLFLHQFSYSLELHCYFEEVHINGEVNQGQIFIKNEKIRYQYFDEQLYTIFIDNQDVFIVMHSNTLISQKYDEDNETLNELIKILNQNIPNVSYETQNGLLVKTEFSENFNFIKRVSVQSKNLNLSIFFNECKTQKLNSLLFNHTPYLKDNNI